MNNIKTWQERAQEGGVWPIFDGATASRYMQSEITELRCALASQASKGAVVQNSGEKT